MNAGVEQSDPMIVVEGLRRSIRNGARTVDILKGIDFYGAAGAVCGDYGVFGSGKSTLLGLLAGLDTPSVGECAAEWDGDLVFAGGPAGAGAREDDWVCVSVVSADSYADGA